MRPSIVLAQGMSHPVSVLLGEGETSNIRPGLKVEITAIIDLSPHTIIQAGEIGVVDYVDELTGLVEIKLEQIHWGLAEWHNCMWLVPYETEELLKSISCQLWN